MGENGDRAVKVYVAMRGCYSDKYVVAVYDSAERAMAALPGEKWEHEGDSIRWTNELDWDDYAVITEMELVGK